MEWFMFMTAIVGGALVLYAREESVELINKGVKKVKQLVKGA